MALIENLSTGTGSYAVGGSTANSQGVDALNAVAIGASAVAASQYATAVGDSSRAPGNSSTAIGRNSSAGGGQSTAIGYNAKVASGKTYAIQIGYGTNSEASTLSVGLSNTSGYNYKLLDADGTIPAARLGTLPAADGTYIPVLTITGGVPTITWTAYTP